MKWARRGSTARDKPSVPVGVIPPMHPTLVDEVPKGPNWHEIKWDGYRIGVYLDGGQVKVLTRNLHDWTEKFPTIVKAVSGLDAVDAVIDGEAFVADERGMSHFNLLQRALGRGRRRHEIMLAVFDLLWLDGEDLREKPLRQRRAALKKLVGETPPDGMVFSDAIEGDAGNLLSRACAFGLEGVVSKRLDSPYRSGRREEWVKAKCIQTDEFIVIGYEPGGSYGGLGSLLLANAEDGKLTYAGGVGTGFNSTSGPAVKRLLDAIVADKPPVPGLRIKGAVVWVEPEVVVEIEYRGWTGDRQLRHPSFQRVREDRSVDEIGVKNGEGR
jgi:bifunctional non-homologous end joining protein LigD